MSIITEKLMVDDLLCQVAEEAAELAQACCKYQRVRARRNPSPISEKEAEAAVIEEIADVNVAVGELIDKLNVANAVIHRIEEDKCYRWIGRLSHGI